MQGCGSDSAGCAAAPGAVSAADPTASVVDAGDAIGELDGNASATLTTDLETLSSVVRALPTGFFPPRNGEAEKGLDWRNEVKSYPSALRWCELQLQHAYIAYKYRGPCPAANGSFPQWEWTGACNSARNEEELRVLGRIRRPVTSGAEGSSPEEGFSAVVEMAFRGTSNIDNWTTNLTCELVASEMGEGVGKVHRGFLGAYELFQQQLLRWVVQGLNGLGEEFGPGVLVHVTGHSMGGALATFAAYDLAARGCAVFAVTWGSPRVGDADFVASYTSSVPRTLRFITKFDPVPRLPPSDSDPINNEADLLHKGIGFVLTRPQTMLGAKGYHHVVRQTQLDDGLASSAAHWANLAALASDKLIGGLEDAQPDHHEVVPHALRVYRRNIHELVNAGDISSARKTKVLTSAVTAGVAAATLLRAVRGKSTRERVAETGIAAATAVWAMQGGDDDGEAGGGASATSSTSSSRWQPSSSVKRPSSGPVADGSGRRSSGWSGLLGMASTFSGGGGYPATSASSSLAPPPMSGKGSGGSHAGPGGSSGESWGALLGAAAIGVGGELLQRAAARHSAGAGSGEVRAGAVAEPAFQIPTPVPMGVEPSRSLGVAVGGAPAGAAAVTAPSAPLLEA